MYIQYLVDHATQFGDPKPLWDVSTILVLGALRQLIWRNAPFQVLVTDNVAYYASAKLAGWCEKHFVEHNSLLFTITKVLE